MTTEPTSEEIEYMETKYGRETMTKNISKDMVDEKALNAALSLLGGRWSDGRRLIEAYLKAAKTSGMGEWQPIESAPKDGTYILAMCAGGKQPVITAFKDGEWRNNHYGSREPYWYYTPLLWQPLPLPPPTNDTEGGGRG